MHESQGFTAHRNTDGATGFMVDKLRFPSKEAAQVLRDEFFLLYHSTAKALTIAEADGRLPEGVHFVADDLDEYWASNLDFSLLGGPDPELVEMFNALSSTTNLKLVAFSNGPRKYVSRALKEIGLDKFFPPENLFAVTDVLPHCKPDKGSFDLVLKQVGVKPQECVMVEDSTKNVRAAKSLGMRTILIMGQGRRKGNSSGDATLDQNAKDAEATKAGDAPDATDTAVDAAVPVASEVGEVLRRWMD